MEKGWQRIYFTDKLHLAQIAKSILEDNGIESVIMDKRDSSLKIGEVELFVKEDDMTLAKFLLQSNNL